MQIDDKKFNDLADDVKAMKEFLLGNEYHKNGIKHRVERLEEKDRKRDKKWWLLIGAFTVLIFLIKWGDKILNIL